MAAPADMQALLTALGINDPANTTIRIREAIEIVDLPGMSNDDIEELVESLCLLAN